MRVGQFISKLILNKHQRALVTSFKKYQIDDLGQSVEDRPESDKLLEPYIQEDGFIFDFNATKGAEFLTREQVALLTEIAQKFCPDDNAADLSILYEVTGYQCESQNFQFWENYQDFDELGGDKLVR